MKTNIHTNFCSEWALGFVIDYAWISKLLRDAVFTWRPSWLKSDLSRDLFRGIWLSEPFLFGNMYYVGSDRCFYYFPAAMLVPIRVGTNMASPYKSLYKFGGKVSSHILHKKNRCDLNLGENLCIVNFFFFSQILYGFDFHLDLFWTAWHWKPAIILC